MRRYHSRYRNRVTLAGAVVGAAIGLAMFLASFGVLWWNEGRTNLAELARAARVAPPGRVDASLDGALVSVTAPTRTDDELADPEYLRPGRYLSLERRAEMFAWVEHVREHGASARPSPGPSPTTTASPTDREYSYTREWTANPPDSGRFRHPRGHENPPMRVRSSRWTLASAAIGAYRFEPGEARLPAGSQLALAPEMLAPNPPEPARLEGGYLFLGRGAIGRPEVGDLRWSYAALAPGAESTLFGAQQGAAVRAHYHDTERFYRLMPGSREAAIAALALEHRATLWMLRAMGFLFMWLGMNLLFGPANAVLDIIPPLGRASRALLFALTLPVALVLSAVVILLAIVTHAALSTLLLAFAAGAGVTALLTRPRASG